MKHIISEPYLTNSRSLRKNQTPWEEKLGYFLRAGRFYGLKFKRQMQIGNFIFDFSCREKMVLVELDCSQHADNAIVYKDSFKTEYAQKQGYKVFRFWNNEIDSNMEGVLQTIKGECKV